MHRHLLNATKGTVAVAFATDALFKDTDCLYKKDPEFLTDEVIAEAFLTHFGQEIRPRAELAREKLHQSKIRMFKEGSEGLLPCIGVFRDIVRDAADMSPTDSGVVPAWSFSHVASRVQHRLQGSKVSHSK